MRADSLSPHRRSIRLPGYDYAQPTNWDRIRRYIEANPCTWGNDDENPVR